MTMRNSIKMLSLAAIATGLSLPATAGGLTEPVPEPVIFASAPVYVPSADWSGAYIGGQLGYGDIGSNGALDGNGVIGGVHAGYLFDMGQFVAGVELDYDKTDIDLGAGGNSLDHVARLKLIAGADMGSTLIYATGGAARAKATVAGNGLSDNGYFLGFGATYAVNDQWTVGGEILGHRFDNLAATTDLKATTVTARVAYRF